MEMARTFNNGIGMVVIVSEEEKERVVGMFRGGGEGEGKKEKEEKRAVAEVYEIGKVVKGRGVEMRNLEVWS